MPKTSTLVHAAIANATAFDECVTCGNRVALVDSTKGRGGQWVHMILPDSVHAPVPKSKRRLS